MNLHYVPQYTWTLRLTFPNQMDEVKEGAFQLLLSKTYPIDIYMGGLWVGIIDDNKKNIVFPLFF